MLMYVFVVVFLMVLILFGLVKWQELSFILSVLMLTMLSEVMFEGETTHISNDYFGVDSLSVYMLLLSNYIIILMYKSNLMAYETNTFMYELIVMGLFLSLLTLFISLSMMMFYIMFEAVLIPTYLLILGWGYQPERMYAGNYLLFYTLFASLPLLGFLIYLDKQCYSLLFIYNFNNSFVSGLMLSLMGLSAFLVKVPMFVFHLWLPKAHVEAPVAGSMILAGVLLKMGGYGLMRMLLYVFDDQPVVNSMVLSVSLIGGVLVGLLCLRQIDLKSLVAYSSVVHMGLMLSGLFSSSYIGMCGSLLLMVGHGLGSSGLFYLSSVIYVRVASRSLIVSSGLMMFVPSVSMLLFMLVSSNMAAPPSLNFIGEIELIASVMSWHTMTVGLLAAISFISGAYCVYMFSSINHGVWSSFMTHMPEVKMMEYYVLILHWVPLNFLFLSGELFVLFL